MLGKNRLHAQALTSELCLPQLLDASLDDDGLLELTVEKKYTWLIGTQEEDNTMQMKIDLHLFFS